MRVVVIGGGFAGTTAAHLLAREGAHVILLEREPHLGGGCRTFFYAGHPFTYGPRLYYGYSAKVFQWVHDIVPIRRFPFELKTLAHEPSDADRKFWTYPPHELDLEHYPRAATIAAELAARDNSVEPRDFDEYWRQKVGPTLYEMFTMHHNRRCWMVESNAVFDTFKWSAKDNPIEKGTRDAYKGSYIGYPVPKDGYNEYFTHMVGVPRVHTIKGQRARWVPEHAEVITDDGGRYGYDHLVSTAPIDELCGHSLGELPYAGRDFHLLLLPCKQILPGDIRWTHYAGENDSWTRCTEFKKVTYHESEDTLLVLERPSKANKLYPFQTKANLALAKRYIDGLPANVHSIGRLGTYRYSTIEQTIVQAFACVAKITGKPNPMEGEFFAIGDKSLLPKDRKEAA